MQSPYNYHAMLRAVVVKGEQMYGPKFRIFEEDKPTIQQLLCWFLHDTALAAEEEVDLEKGILLTGPVGCGKSAIMKILCNLCKPR